MSAAVSVLAFGLALALGSPDEKAPAKNFQLDVSGTTTALRAGKTGKLAVQIKPAEGYKVNEKGPLSLALTAPATLKLDKARLVRADAQGKATSPQFACGFKAQKQGQEPITVNATFVICDTAGTICEMKREKVQVAVRVEP